MRAGWRFIIGTGADGRVGDRAKAQRNSLKAGGIYQARQVPDIGHIDFPKRRGGKSDFENEPRVCHAGAR